MGLLYDLETRLDRQLPVRLQPSLRQALDDYQPLCPDCGLAMHRHHHYAHTITTHYGTIPRERRGCGHRIGHPDGYGRPAPHQLCHFHVLREYRRNIGETGRRRSDCWRHPA